MSTRYLLVADPVDTLNPTFDLGVCLSTELLRRGIAVDYLDLLASDVELPPQRYLEQLPVREILASDATAAPFWKLGPERAADVREYKVILQRKDPPVDDRFIAYARKFEAAPRSIVQINHPPAVYELSEHTVALRYPEYAAPATVCRTADEVMAAVRAEGREAVVKPKNTYCGFGIGFFAPDAPASELEAHFREWGPELIVQPYLSEIEETGDLRILTLGGRVLGSVLRVPRPGSRLANLHQGAEARAFEPTPRQLEACRVVAEDLGSHGLHLLGLDFIGEHLTEVNFTSPTLVVQINRVMNKRADVEMVDELERMWRERVGTAS